jgi:hypothetical protein
MNKFSLYPYMYPFSTRLHRRLRAERIQTDYSTFAAGIGEGADREEICRFLWDCLRDEIALVPDFRPDVNDDLKKVYAMGPEEIVDDFLEPLATQLSLDVEGVDFKALGFHSINTVVDFAHFMMRLAESQESKQPDSLGTSAG